MSRHVLKALLVSVAVGALCGTAHAYEGWAYQGAYVRGDLGYNFDGEFDIDDNLGLGALSIDEDWMASVGGGYSWASGFRAEGEFAWRDNDLSTDFGPAGGSVSSWALMLNGYYDFNKSGRFQPYVGAGVGVVGVEGDGDTGLLLGSGFNAESTTWGWQALLGVAFAATDQLLIDVGYRYFAVSDVETDVFLPTTFVESEAEYTHQAVTIGIRYNLTPPPPPPPPPMPPPRPAPPPPPPAAATCPQSDFVVYFEWDRSNLNQEAQETIQAAIARARQCAVSQAQIVGHTDTSGSAEYNVGLSERRAGVVRDALVAAGLSASLIQTQARGETDLAQSTADGVREPLNRRAAVTISFR